MNETSPINPTEDKGRVRAKLWQTLIDAAHTHGLKVSELRASDYFGPEAGNNAHAGTRLTQPIKEGKTAWTVGNPDAPHSWSYLPDIGQCLAILATTPELAGQYWVGPNSGDATLRDLAQRINPDASVKQVPAWALRLLGVFSPVVREVARVHYQHTEPYLMDDSALRSAFDFTPTPLNVAWDTCALS